MCVYVYAYCSCHAVQRKVHTHSSTLVFPYISQEKKIPCSWIGSQYIQLPQEDKVNSQT